MSTTLWTRCSEQLPPEGVKVDTMSAGGLQQPLTRRGNLWFLGHSTYVYYTPTHWRHIDG